MFTLQIHSVDIPQRLPITIPGGSNPKAGVIKDENAVFRPAELRGIAHLFRQLPPSNSSAGTIFLSTTIANPHARTTRLFIVAVPNYMSYDDFILFCGPDVNCFLEIIFLRNDGVKDWYSVLIRLESQFAADGFYLQFNGKRFRPSEAEVCRIYFTQSVECFEVAEIASAPPPGFTELPTCPICLERLDQDTSGIQFTLCDHSFHCSCVSKWTYPLSCQVCRLCQQQDDKPTCAVCGILRDLWICLICGFVGCGRYEEGHAIIHWSDKQHHYSLELETQQIWDYVGGKYVHRLNQSKTDGKSIVMNSQLVSTDVGCSTSGYEEDSGLDGALFSSKVDAIVDEYDNLLASELDFHKQHYESLLAEAKASKGSTISKAVEKATVSALNDLQYKLEGCEAELKPVSEMYEELVKKQDLLQQEYKEKETRYSLVLKDRDEVIMTLEEQIRDIQGLVEALKKIAGIADSESIKEGIVLPIESTSQSPGNSRRRSKSGKRRG